MKLIAGDLLLFPGQRIPDQLLARKLQTKGENATATRPSLSHYFAPIIRHRELSVSNIAQKLPEGGRRVQNWLHRRGVPSRLLRWRQCSKILKSHKKPHASNRLAKLRVSGPVSTPPLTLQPVTIGSTSRLPSGSLAASSRPTAAGAAFGSLLIPPIGRTSTAMAEWFGRLSRRSPPSQGYPPGGRRSHLPGIPPDVGRAAADSLPSDWIGCRGGIWGSARGIGDVEGARDVGHRAVDSDAELRAPEIGPDGIEDGEGDIPVEAELVDCGGVGAPQGRARRMIDSLPVDRSWYKWREGAAKSSGRDPN
jgi:hypothetical protein